MTQTRKSYEDSCKVLQKDYLDNDIIPPLPTRRPLPDDEDPLGVSFFKTYIGDGDDLCNLTLPRTFISRSEINDVNFSNTDLSESSLSWNDFINVNFTFSSLKDADARSSNFEKINFTNADLTNTEFQHSSFDNCCFLNAIMNGTLLTNKQGEGIELSDLQRSNITWLSDDGPEPPGG